MNDQPRCRYAGPEQPRVLTDRHADECDHEGCPGCLPCPMDHCRVCSVTHASGSCASCLDEVRGNLDDIGRMCANLPTEAMHRGVEGEAFNLLGPVADPESIGHMEASVIAGRVPPEYLETVVGELHPEYLSERWASIYREAFDHDEPIGKVRLHDELGYLGRNLTEAGDYPWVPFEDFAHDVRRCVAHLERVLHDGEQVDRGAPCMTCGRPLERTWGMSPDHDGWRCPRCRTTSTDAQYRFAVAHLHREEATHLTDRDMELRTGIKAGTVRVWALRGLISRRVESGRVVFSVAEVEAEARQRGLLAS